METLEIHSLTQAIICIRMETNYLNVCRAIRGGQVADYFIHSRKRANLYEYVLTSQPVQVDFAD